MSFFDIKDGDHPINRIAGPIDCRLCPHEDKYSEVKPNLVKILKEELTEINKKEYVALDILLDAEGIQIKVSDFKPVEEWKKIKERGYFLYGRRKYQFKYPVTLGFDGATSY